MDKKISIGRIKTMDWKSISEDVMRARKWIELKEQLTEVLSNYTEIEVQEGVADEDIAWKVKQLLKYEISWKGKSK